eukprot:Polyplicarium_translucidae@DN3327_c0_g2_i11.p1
MDFAGRNEPLETPWAAYAIVFAVGFGASLTILILIVFGRVMWTNRKRTTLAPLLRTVRDRVEESQRQKTEAQEQEIQECAKRMGSLIAAEKIAKIKSEQQATKLNTPFFGGSKAPTTKSPSALSPAPTGVRPLTTGVTAAEPPTSPTVMVPAEAPAEFIVEVLPREDVKQEMGMLEDAAELQKPRSKMLEVRDSVVILWESFVGDAEEAEPKPMTVTDKKRRRLSTALHPEQKLRVRPRTPPLRPDRRTFSNLSSGNYEFSSDSD